MAQVNIIRVKKNKNYFAVSNIPFNDERLSWEARGVMGYLLSKPDDWTVKSTDLIKRGPAGERKVLRILKELEDLGYLERKKVQDPEGKFSWVSTIYEDPTMNPNQGSGEDHTIPAKQRYGDREETIPAKEQYGDREETIPRLSTHGLSTHGLSRRGKARSLISTDLTNTESKNTESINTEVEAASTKEKRAREESPQNGETATASDFLPSSQIIGVISQATGMVAIPPNELQRIEQIHLMLDHYGVDAVRDALAAAFKLWIDQSRQDGRGKYKRTNFGWVDWAQEKLAGGVMMARPETKDESIRQAWLKKTDPDNPERRRKYATDIEKYQ